ncbi:hypothetical protein EVAR_35374_1 [Eumeta japonica]|uniref:Uncharacterized protein n=1 Tax=Eumeta variegata TaxID=151549 RepID=A0A4C2A665_EUMVA|nr:hypothetical protein EVAR_35374_1 [Eumeta japonica]
MDPLNFWSTDHTGNHDPDLGLTLESDLGFALEFDSGLDIDIGSDFAVNGAPLFRKEWKRPQSSHRRKALSAQGLNRHVFSEKCLSRHDEASENKWSPPVMDTRTLRGITIGTPSITYHIPSLEGSRSMRKGTLGVDHRHSHSLDKTQQRQLLHHIRDLCECDISPTELAHVLRPNWLEDGSTTSNI